MIGRSVASRPQRMAPKTTGGQACTCGKGVRAAANRGTQKTITRRSSAPRCGCVAPRTLGRRVRERGPASDRGHQLRRSRAWQLAKALRTHRPRGRRRRARGVYTADSYAGVRVGTLVVRGPPLTFRTAAAGAPRGRSGGRPCARGSMRSRSPAPAKPRSPTSSVAVRRWWRCVSPLGGPRQRHFRS